MKFHYRPHLTMAPETGEANIILRPEIAVTIIGPAGHDEFLGLLDTGADNTVLPKSVADRLGIELEPCAGPDGSAFGGGTLSFFFGHVVFRLCGDDEEIEWPACVLFHDFASADDEAIVFGHAGFLDLFRSTFDPEVGLIELHANGLFPE